MADDVFTPDPDATRNGTVAVTISPATAGLRGAEQVVWLTPGYIGPVGTWDSGPDDERIRVVARITEWNGQNPNVEYERA
jgi:hypothetical protein